MKLYELYLRRYKYYQYTELSATTFPNVFARYSEIHDQNTKLSNKIISAIEEQYWKEVIFQILDLLGPRPIAIHCLKILNENWVRSIFKFYVGIILSTM